jgi:hypothetical protein
MMCRMLTYLLQSAWPSGFKPLFLYFYTRTVLTAGRLALVTLVVGESIKRYGRRRPFDFSGPEGIRSLFREEPRVR